jgi:hypothetical protein
MATFCPEGLCTAELCNCKLPGSRPMQKMHSLPDHAVCAFSNHILYVVLFRNVEGDLARPRWRRSSLCRHCADECWSVKLSVPVHRCNLQTPTMFSLPKSTRCRPKYNFSGGADIRLDSVGGGGTVAAPCYCPNVSPLSKATTMDGFA